MTVEDVHSPPPAGQPPPIPTAAQLRSRENRALKMMGCGLTALWVVGGTVTLLITAANAITAGWVCADSGTLCDSRAPELTLLIGLVILAFITIIWVLSYIIWVRTSRSRRRD